MLKSSARRTLVAASAFVGLGASLVFADAVDDRQATMKAIGKAIGALAAIAKGEAPFDAAVVKENASTIAAKLEAYKDMFPEGSQKGGKETWAKPEAWTDRAGFEAARRKAHDAAVALAAVSNESQFGSALGALGDGCKGCHEKYRRPKD